MRAAPTKIRHIPRKEAPRELLELFFPIHYVVGMAIEDTLRAEKTLNRHQTVIMWLIRAQGTNGKVIRRKDVEAALTNWFEITSSSVSKALRAMSRPPLELIDIREDPHSGREKVIALTAKGDRYLKGMDSSGRALMDWAAKQMTQDEINMGVHFLSKVSEIFERGLPSIDDILPRSRRARR